MQPSIALVKLPPADRLGSADAEATDGLDAADGEFDFGGHIVREDGEEDAFGGGGEGCAGSEEGVKKGEESGNVWHVLHDNDQDFCGQGFEGTDWHFQHIGHF